MNLYQINREDWRDKGFIVQVSENLTSESSFVDHFHFLISAGGPLRLFPKAKNNSQLSVWESKTAEHLDFLDSY